jgi:hypothetical protein
MTNLIRFVLWAAWVCGIAWLRHFGFLGVGSACAASALGLALFAWPSATARRRRDRTLRYVELAKQPMDVRQRA